MQEPLVTTLRAHRHKVREHWGELLRAEPVTTPLGHPDALVHLIDWTLDEIFTALGNPLARHRAGATRFAHQQRPECPCGRNPLLAFYAAGEQAMLEALVHAQAAARPLDPLERDASFEDLKSVVQQISRREVESFCGLCQHRAAAIRGHIAETRTFAAAGAG